MAFRQVEMYMNPESSHRTKELFFQAMDLAAEEREAFIRRACSDEGDVEYLLSLLASSEEAENQGFMDGLGLTALNLGTTPIECLIGQRVGNYQILKALGRGGMGAVYLAEQLEPVRRLVALKFINSVKHSRILERIFKREEQVLAILQNPFIAQVYEFGSTMDERSYFVMEYVDGKAITRFCDDNRLSVRQRVELFRKVCDAITHAHRRNVMHRDIKPSNVLVTLDHATPTPKVIDFGIAKALDWEGPYGTLSDFEIFMGTPMYMSPEQAGFFEGAVDHRTDIYSLGMVLYELLVGRLPVDLDQLRDLPPIHQMEAVHKEVFSKPSDLLGQSRMQACLIAARRDTTRTKLARVLKRDLDWIVMKALAKSPDERYRSVAEMSDDLDRFLGGRTIQARPISGFQVMVRRAQRSRLKWPATVTATALIALLCLFLTRSWFRAAPPLLNPNDENRVIILPFENRTNQKTWDWVEYGLMDMVRTSLDRVPRLSTIPTDDLPGVCELEKGNEEPAGNLDQLNQLRHAFNAGILLTTEIYRHENRFRCKVNFVLPDRENETLELTANSLPELGKLLTRRLLTRFGYDTRHGEYAASFRGDHFVNRAYAMGLQDFYLGRPAPAHSHFETAREQDPDFLWAEFHRIKCDLFGSDRQNEAKDRRILLGRVRKHANAELEGYLLLCLGKTTLLDGHYKEADRYFEDALQAARRSDMPAWEGEVHFSRGHASYLAGRMNAAEQSLQRAQAFFERIGNPVKVAKVQLLRGLLDLKAGRMSQARDWFERSQFAFKERNYHQLQTIALLCLVRANLDGSERSGFAREALDRTRQVLARNARHHNELVELVQEAEIALENNRPEQFDEVFTRLCRLPVSRFQGLPLIL